MRNVERRTSHVERTLLFLFLFFLPACAPAPETADLILYNANVYTFSWDDPDLEGIPAADAPFRDGAWHADAEAVVVKDGGILYVGTTDEAKRYAGASTRMIDLEGQTLIPGLVDSHTHVGEFGMNLDLVDLTSAQTEVEAVERMVERAAKTPPGEWLVGFGWDEGAWANRYPDHQRLTERVPNHPVVMRGLHGFAAWGNRMALEAAGITADTQAPVGGEIPKDAAGNPTGLLLNNATDLLYDAVPPPPPARRKAQVVDALVEMAKSGYVAVHEAGTDGPLMETFEELQAQHQLPIRVYAMLKASDESLLRSRLTQGPNASPWLGVRSVKAYYDGALGSRGARLLEDYTDAPGHCGVSGADYGFNEALVDSMIQAGFQVGIHAIGDAGNRETLDFLSACMDAGAPIPDGRHRIEHAQVIHTDDMPRFGDMQLIASMEPPHAVEDKTWAEDRLGPERIKGAYAWRTLRKNGAGLVFNADLPGSDHSFFYGFYAAVTRRSKDLQPPDGWYMEEAVTPEEAVRAYTVWPAYAAFREKETGTLEPGKWADLTILNIDLLNVALTQPDQLLDGEIAMTIVDGQVVYERPVQP